MKVFAVTFILSYSKRFVKTILYKKNRRNYSLAKEENEFEFCSPVKIIIESDADIVTKTAAFDFTDYLFTSMNISAYVQNGGEATDGCVKIVTNKVKPGVEIILSSYNWGYQPAELRDELTAILPKDTIPLVEADSVLGFEPSMEYVTDRKRIEWKIAQVEKEAQKLCGMK